MNTMIRRSAVAMLRTGFVLTTLLLLAACGKQPATSAAQDGVSFKDWGPKSMVLGTIPNVQPGGAMGVWIQVTNKFELGNYKVLFDGQVLSATGGDDTSITAGVPATLLQTVGPKTIAIQRIQDGKLFEVGTFQVNAVVPASSVGK